MPLKDYAEMPSDRVTYAISVFGMSIGQTFNQY